MNYITGPIFKNYFNFSGRASRREFGSFCVLVILLAFIIEFASYPIDMIASILVLLIIIPWVALIVR